MTEFDKYIEELMIKVAAEQKERYIRNWRIGLTAFFVTAFVIKIVHDLLK